jgi:uncharacterized protein (DUF433 family)
MTTTEYAHIALTAEGIPVVAGTQTKVVEVALDHLAHAWDAREIHRQHPHLSLGQILSALAYYYDHQPEMDAQIEGQCREVERIRGELSDGRIRAKLKAMGILP